MRKRPPRLNAWQQDLVRAADILDELAVDLFDSNAVDDNWFVNTEREQALHKEWTDLAKRLRKGATG